MPSNSASYLRARTLLLELLKEIPKPVLVGVSGGADSLALAKVLFDVKGETQVIPIIVNHNLQEISNDISLRTKNILEQMGYEKVHLISTQVEITDGVEASARRARYRAFESALREFKSEALLLAHTLDDQAESILLGLSRGSGARSLSGMKVKRPPYYRPFLELTRKDMEEICGEFNLEYWNDPFNEDLTLFRSKVRKVLRPVLEEVLGGQVYEALAKSALIFQNDQDYLFSIAQGYLETLPTPTFPFALEIESFAKLHSAIRLRVFRELLYLLGAPSGKVNYGHLLGADELISNWHGQKGVNLPGEITLTRKDGKLWFTQEKSLG